MRRVGSLREYRVNVRLITATNRNLVEEVKAGPIPRGSLLPHQHCANCICPHLGNGRGDIRLLSRSSSARDGGSPPMRWESWRTTAGPAISDSSSMRSNAAKILADDQVIITSESPGRAERSARSGRCPERPFRGRRFEIAAKIEGHRDPRARPREQTRAARLLGVTRRSLYRLLERYGLDDEGADDRQA